MCEADVGSRFHCDSRGLQDAELDILDHVADTLSVRFHVGGDQVLLQMCDRLPFFDDGNPVFFPELTFQVGYCINSGTILDAAGFRQNGRYNPVEFSKEAFAAVRGQVNLRKNMNHGISVRLGEGCFPGGSFLQQRLPFSITFSDVSCGVDGGLNVEKATVGGRRGKRGRGSPLFLTIAHNAILY